MAPTFKELKRDMIPIFDDILSKHDIPYELHKTDFYYTFPWTKGRLYLFSAETKLRGPNLAYFGFNEVTLIPPERFMEGIGRVRIKGTRCSQIASVGTPEGIGNFMYERFVEKPMPNSRIIYGDTRDNLANLDEGYVHAMESSFDKIMLDAYLRGLWVNMNGQNWYYSFDPHKHHNKTIEEDKKQMVHVGLDFNVEHMTATMWHYDGQKLYGFDEIVIEKNADTHKMCEALKARGYMPERTIIYPDPSGRNRSTKGSPDHEILRQNGFKNIRARLAQPRMRQRQLNVNNILDKCQLQFNPVKMPAMNKDLQAVETDPIKLDKSKKNPKLTHASDGLDYMCDILFEFSGHKPESTILKYR